MPVPPALFGTPVTLDELWQNILADLGHAGRPSTLGQIMKDLDNALFNRGTAAYGNASDGVQTFNGTSTVLGLVPSSSVYTLTRDIWLATGSVINSGVTIKTAGFRIFCQGNLVNNGTIQSNGNAAAANVAGAALAYTGTISATTVGTAGGAGGTGAGAAGTNGAANGLGGAGGVGGASAVPNAGGAGGTVTAPAATVLLPYTIALAAQARLLSGTAYVVPVAGSGGGAGGGDGTNNSGAGGGGGGIVVVVAQTISGTGTISANGGAGGAANATGNSAGGAGGGGGLVIVISASVVSNAQSGTTAALAGQTITAAGGAGGAGTGTGAVGGAGAAGTVILLAA